MTKKTQKHPAIAPDETVIQASYGLSRGFVRFANRAADPTPASGPRNIVWSDEMGEAEGLAEPLENTGVLALTDRRLLFFKKAFAIGSPKTLTAEWPLDQVLAIEYDEAEHHLMVRFSDGTGAALHVPRNQWPDKMVDGFAALRRTD